MSLPQDPTKPESIIAQAFTGLKNTITPERLQMSELERAINIDLDDAGQPRRRRGYSKVLDGIFHSAHTLPDGRTLVVKDEVLGYLAEGYAFTGLATVGPDRLSYAHVDGVTYFSSRAASGKVMPTQTVLPWGAYAGSTTWVSPVMTPTETLGAISGKLLGPPPLATEIAYHNGRIWMMVDKALWATELYLYDYVDKTRTFFQLEEEGLMLAPVEGGIFVGTQTTLYFLRGNQLAEMRLETLARTRVVPGTLVRCSASDIRSAGQGASPEGEAVIFLTDTGMTAGMPGGQLFNLTGGTVELPSAIQGAGLLRNEMGVSSYIASVDSGGDPSTTAARIGDYVDAEIVRFQG